jgi:alkanesulfonate monooxygenase SsuD/methylene tetrahydromethanopterin reductase-like flavin-dependent oxidoreductase (luciferase family)
MDYFETLWEEIKAKAFFFGTPDEIVEKIEDFAADGFNHFVFRVQWLGAPHETSLRILERFAAEVLPRVRANVELEVTTR